MGIARISLCQSEPSRAPAITCWGFRAAQGWGPEEGPGAAVLTPIDDPRLESRLLERIWNGDIEFDIPSGRVIRRSTGIDRRVVGFSGQESSVRYRSTLEERLISEAAPEDVPSAPATE